MPEVKQDSKDHYLCVQSGYGSTVALPADSHAFTGEGSLSPIADHHTVVVRAGATLQGSVASVRSALYVEAGGIMECSDSLIGKIVFAEDGALLDFTRITEVAGSAIYLSPHTVVLGDRPTNTPTTIVRELSSLLVSPDVDTIGVGFPLTLDVDGPGTVSAVPDRSFYAYGESVRLTASPNTNCFFVRWLGSAQGIGPVVDLRIRGRASASARFSENPDYFRVWRPRHFSAEELGDLEVSGADADPDGDGYTNAAEYIFGSNPRVSEDARRTHTYAGRLGDEAQIFLRYVRPVTAADVLYRVEVSQNLVVWNHNENGTETLYSREIAREAIAGGLERVTVQLYPEGPLPPMAFSRVNATLFE